MADQPQPDEPTRNRNAYYGTVGASKSYAWKDRPRAKRLEEGSGKRHLAMYRGLQRHNQRNRKAYAELNEKCLKLEEELHQYRLAGKATVRRVDKAQRVSATGKLTGSEEIFAKTAESKGYRIYHRGWPDFLCVNPDGRIHFIEVKYGGDKLSEHQVSMFAALEECGVHVKVCRPEWDQPVPWRTFLTGTEVESSRGADS